MCTNTHKYTDTVLRAVEAYRDRKHAELPFQIAVRFGISEVTLQEAINKLLPW